MKTLLLILLTACSVNAGQMSSSASNLVGLWHFNEGTGATTRNEIPLAANASISNAAWVSSRFGSGISFNGATNSIVTIARSTYLEPARVFSVGAWYYASVAPTAFDHNCPNRIINKFYSTEAPWVSWDINVHNGAPYYIAADITYGSTIRGIYSTITPKVGSWYFVVLTSDSVGAKLYVNGVYIGSADGVGDIPYGATKNLEIGGNSSETYCELKGVVDEVFFMNGKTLSGGEVNRIYAEGLGGHSNAR
jgi:hypothetical protein